MAEKSSRNTRLFVAAEVILLLLIAAAVFVCRQTDGLIAQRNAFQREAELAETQQLEQEAARLEEELSQKRAQLARFDGMEQRAADAEKDYYVAIKELEDAILAGTSNAKIAYLTFDDGPYYNTYRCWRSWIATMSRPFSSPPASTAPPASTKEASAVCLSTRRTWTMACRSVTTPTLTRSTRVFTRAWIRS